MTVIDQQAMRYLNLLDKITHVKTNRCFNYNNMLIFAVPAQLVSKAIGSNAVHVKEIQNRLNKRVRIINQPNGITEADQFIKDIVAPVSFKSLEIKDRVVIITAGPQSKAALFGRNKRRYEELKQIIEDTFNHSLKII